MNAQTEADKFGAFVRRVIRAYGRRVADRDIEALAGLAQLRRDIDDQLQLAVDQLRAQGYSWSDIGNQLGISKQGASQRFGPRA